MAIQWYYGRGTDITGPFSGPELAHLANSGTVLPTDTVWQEGVEMGVLATRVKNLFTHAPADAAARGAGALPAEVSSQLLQEVVILPPGGLTALDRSEGSPPPPDVETIPAVSAGETQPQGSVSAESTTPGGAAPEAIPDDPELKPLEEPQATATQPPAQQARGRKARATAGKGVMIVAQDSTNVKYRMKCTGCGYEDTSWKTMPITRGMTRLSFFCPKCRKRRDGEIHGVL
jgi:GYF domain 2